MPDREIAQAKAKKSIGYEYRALLGLVLSNWQQVEIRLEIIFLRLVPVDPEIGYTIFESMLHVETKLRAVDALIQRRLQNHPDFITEEWSPLYDRVDVARRKRNDIVHGFTIPSPVQHADRPVKLLHVRSVAKMLIANIKSGRVRLPSQKESKTEKQVQTIAADSHSIAIDLAYFEEKLAIFLPYVDKSAQ